MKGGWSMSDGFIAVFGMGFLLGIITAIIILGVMKHD